MSKLVEITQLRERILAMKDVQIWAMQEEIKAREELNQVEGA